MEQTCVLEVELLDLLEKKYPGAIFDRYVRKDKTPMNIVRTLLEQQAEEIIEEGV